MTAELISSVIMQGRLLASHSWEYGTLSEALLEWYNPEVSVFSKCAFSDGQIPALEVSSTQSLSYAITNIRTNSTTLVDGDGKQLVIICVQSQAVTDVRIENRCCWRSSLSWRLSHSHRPDAARILVGSGGSSKSPA